MTSPILRLHDHIWTYITDYLDLTDVTRLLMTGNVQLAVYLDRNAHRTRLHYESPVLDIEAVTRSCSALHSLQELVVKRASFESLVKRPCNDLVLPPKLSSLILEFTGSFDLVLSLNLAEITPLLRHLRLGGDKQLKEHQLEDIRLPNDLEVLELFSTNTAITLVPSGIAKLPRNLSTLVLDCQFASIAEEFESYEWPLSLTSCTLKTVAFYLRIEDFPRTVTHLDLRGATRLQTTFRGPQFPWRVFFPFLHTLYLSQAVTLNQTLLRALVQQDFQDTATVQAFIASGYWDIPSLRPDPSGPPPTYPLFETIQIPQKWRPAFLDRFERSALAEIAPHLKYTEAHLNSAMVTLAALPSQLGATSMGSIATSVNSTRILPSSITSLSVDSFLAAAVPKSVTKLVCSLLTGCDEKDPSIISQGDIPPNLTYLRYSSEQSVPFPFPLPRMITNLEAVIKTPKHWDLIAQNLVHLKTLVVVGFNSWDCNTTLAPIVSSDFADFTLRASSRGPDDTTRPIHEEFFGPASPLPPSLTHLKISGGCWHASILASLAELPFRLKALDIAPLVWDEECSRHPPYPAGQSKSPKELLHALRKHPIIDLVLYSDYQTLQKFKVSLAALQGLPPSLRFLKVGNLFNGPVDSLIQSHLPEGLQLLYGLIEARPVSTIRTFPTMN